MLWTKKNKKNNDHLCEDTSATFSDGRVIWNHDVSNYVKQHIRFVDRFNTNKVVSAALNSFAALASVPEDKTKKP